MPIVDNVLVGSGGHLPSSDLPAGQHLKNVIQQNVEAYGDSVWMTDVTTGKSMTYSQLVNAMDRVASALRRRGFKPNDCVMYASANHVEVPVVSFAVWSLGGVNAGLTLNLFAAHIRQRAIETGAKFVVTDELRAARVLEAVEKLESVKEVFVIGQHPGCTSVDQLLQHEVLELSEGDDMMKDFDAQSMAWLMYSSGTTGTPKAIIHSHSSVSQLINIYTRRFCVRRKFLYLNLIINPSGMSITLGATVSHTMIHCLSNYSDDKFLESIDRIKPYQISCFPTQIAWMCQHADLHKYDLSSVVVVLTCGSCLNPTFERSIFDKFPNMLALNITYAMSETLVIATNTLSPEEMATLDHSKAVERHVIGSSGKLLPFNKLKIIDPDSGEKLGPGQVGEICIYTPYLTKGYLNKPSETANAIRQGWVHTGDRGYYDSHENIFIIGRYKELVKYRCAQVVPTNIEKHLITHPAVEDAAVVGLPHDVDDERPLAFVVLKKDQSANAEELVQFIDERVIDEERLRGGIRFIDKVPRNDMGKIVRHELFKFLQ